jgi:hypothetical protein
MTYPEGVEGFEELRRVSVWQAPLPAARREGGASDAVCSGGEAAADEEHTADEEQTAEERIAAGAVAGGAAAASQAIAPAKETDDGQGVSAGSGGHKLGGKQEQQCDGAVDQKQSVGSSEQGVVGTNNAPSKAAAKQEDEAGTHSKGAHSGGGGGGGGGGAKQALPFHLPPMGGRDLPKILPHERLAMERPLPPHMQLAPWDLVTGEPLSMKARRK